MLNENDKKFNETMLEAQNISLTPQEKEEIKANLMNFIKTYSPPAPVAKPQSAWFAWQSNVFKKKMVFQYAAVGLVITGLAGFGVCSAAQKALPGDLLYPVKTQINEKAVAMLQFNEAAKANYNIHLVNVRLKEMEKITASDKLDKKNSTDVTNSLNAHIEKAKRNIKNIEGQQQNRQSIEAASSLEVSLHDHTQILNTLEVNHGSEELKKAIENIKEKTKEINLNLDINNL